MLTEENLNSLRLLNEMAQQRGQSMAQMALSWLLKKTNQVTSVLIGASRPEQLEEKRSGVGEPDVQHRRTGADR